MDPKADPGFSARTAVTRESSEGKSRIGKSSPNSKAKYLTLLADHEKGNI
jgi:hypothetical protein